MPKNGSALPRPGSVVSGSGRGGEGDKDHAREAAEPDTGGYEMQCIGHCSQDGLFFGRRMAGESAEDYGQRRS